MNLGVSTVNRGCNIALTIHSISSFGLNKPVFLGKDIML